MTARNDEVVLGDGQGTTRATVDPVQAVTSTFTSDGFGNPVAQWGSSANPYRYAGAWGYRDDGDAGLLHVGARYYDPQVGRFTSRDAVLSEHPYLYCEHEPVNSVDPRGNIPQWLQDLGGLLMDVGSMIWAIEAPPVAAVLIIVGGTIVGIGIGLDLGEYLGDILFPWDPDDLYSPLPEPAPSPGQGSTGPGGWIGLHSSLPAT